MKTARLLVASLLTLLGAACSTQVATESTITDAVVTTTSATAAEPTLPATSTTIAMTTATTTTATTTTATTTSTTQAPTEPTAALPGVDATGNVVERTLVTADGRTRVYRTYVPSALPDGPVPLLLAFHGGTGWGQQFQRNSGFDELAEANGFLVVYPDGIGSGVDETTNRTWNGGECCGAAARNNVDDVAFVSQLLDTLTADYEIDTSRVFAAGHSNGGIFSYRLACELSDRIVAVGHQAGTLGIENCAPTDPVSLLHIHGEADLNLPIDGGVGPNSLAGVDFTSPRAAVQTFASANGCGAEPMVTGDESNTDLSISTWTGCEGGAEVEFLAVAGAAHSWMGHVPSNPAASPAYPDLDASYEIVNFLLAHPRTP